MFYKGDVCRRGHKNGSSWCSTSNRLSHFSCCCRGCSWCGRIRTVHSNFFIGNDFFHSLSKIVSFLFNLGKQLQRREREWKIPIWESPLTPSTTPYPNPGRFDVLFELRTSGFQMQWADWLTDNSHECIVGWALASQEEILLLGKQVRPPIGFKYQHGSSKWIKNTTKMKIGHCRPLFVYSRSLPNKHYNGAAWVRVSSMSN